MLTASLTAQGQVFYKYENPSGATLLNVTGTVGKKEPIPVKDSIPLKFTHLSGGIVDGGYSRLVMRPTEFSGLTFNQSPWVVKTSQADNFTDLQINSKYDKPITFTIDDVVYLVYQKKVYKLLK